MKRQTPTTKEEALKWANEVEQEYSQGEYEEWSDFKAFVESCRYEYAY